MIHRALIVLVACVPGSVDAGSCAVRVRKQVVIQEVAQAVAVPVAVAQYIPVQVPAYSVGYAPDYDLRQLVAELREEIKALRQQAPAAGPAEEPAVLLFRNRCISCHEAGVSATKGGKFTLLNKNEVVVPGPKQLALIATKTSLGHMPAAGPKLTPEELGDIMQWVEEQTQK